MAIVALLIRVSLTAWELDGWSSKISHWMRVLLPPMRWVRVGRVYPLQRRQQPCDDVWSISQCRHLFGVYVRWATIGASLLDWVARCRFRCCPALIRQGIKF
jgi:hypothetical protein